jgi:hypothetical protein
MYYRGNPKVNVFFYSLIFTLNHKRPKMSKFDTSDKKFIETIFFKCHIRHHSPMQTARASAKLEETWSLAAVARELHCSKTCIFSIKRGWQEKRLERPMRIGVGKVSLLKFTFTLIMY